MTDEPTARRMAMRQLMETFLEDRLNTKIEKLEEDDPKRDAKIAEFKLETWVEKASIRAKQIRVVTHIIKSMHPDAKGTELFCTPQALPLTKHMSSQHLDETVHDVTGNAAALDVAAFLALVFEDKSLLWYMECEDDDLLNALSDDINLARQWARAFAAIKKLDEQPSSHTFAKQIYWLTGEDPVDDKQYHILAPLFASPLAQRVHETIYEHRFGDEAKAARKAKKEEKYSDKTIYEYRSLAQRKFGGSKPQNISQLNSKRGGVNILLSSQPPAWKFAKLSPPYGKRPFFEQFAYSRKPVRRLVKRLKEFLETDPQPTKETRDKRDKIIAEIISEAVLYAAELKELVPGWSADKRCSLSDAEKLWLDPDRALSDPVYAEALESSNWREAVAKDFGRWLNNTLSTELPLGDIEHQFWSDMFEEESPQAEEKLVAQR